MREKKQVTQLMLELYHLNAVTNKERKIIEEALANDDDVRTRYEELKRLDKEIKSKLKIDTPPVFTVINNNENISNKIKTRKTMIGIGIAAVILCLCVPAFIYFGNSKKGTSTEITENDIEQNNFNEDKQIIVIDSNDTNIENEKVVVKPTDKKEPVKKNNIINEKETVTVAEVPNTQHEIYTRGGTETSNQNNTNNIIIDESYREQGNINIPPGLTAIFNNMFANGNYTEVILPERIKKIGSNAFANNPIVSFTLGADVDIEDNAVPGNFANAYKNNGKAAGTYIRPNITSNEWKKQ